MGLQDLVSGKASLKDLRDVRIEDLLGREPVELDWRAITEATRRKTVLVTGGGGSIGAELSRQLARLEPSRLIILDRSEFNLYSIDIELRQSMPDLSLVSLLVDVNDAMQMEKILRAYAPSVIYHAAAYKHVPILEDQARAAVVNNVLGTRVVAGLAEKFGCQSFVMVSTDKAVAWIPEAPPVSTVMAGFMTIHNPDAADLKIVAVHSEKFSEIQMHLSVEENGVAKMLPQKELVIPARGDLVMKQGSFHLMLFNPVAPLKAGDKVSLNVTFADGSRLPVVAEVKKAAGMKSKSG